MTTLTVVIVDQTSFMNGTKRLMHVMAVFDLKSQRIEGIWFVLSEAAFSAHKLTDLVSFENVVDQVFLGGILKFIFQTIKESV